jgi:hypothetical protein
MIACRRNARRIVGAIVGALGPLVGCVDVLGINTDRPYVAEAGLSGPDATGGGDDSPADDTSDDGADPALDSATDAVSERPVDSDSSIKPVPSCPIPDGSMPRIPFAASAYLVGSQPSYAAGKSACGRSVHFGNSSTARVETENFDVGGQSITYFDTTPGNFYGQYRGEDVDVEWGVCTPDPCLTVDHIAPTEWSEYTIDVTQTWSYSIILQYAAKGNEGLHIDLDGRMLSGPLTMPQTTFATATFTSLSYRTLATFVNVCIPQGRHILRLTFDGPTENALALDYVDFQPFGACAGSGGDGGGASDAMGRTQ